ncbi:MAG: hypothetical protein O3C43_23760 [Verrucomicrobia bacterium]|nr:hypothetical protein [Verrucomicrobiota bacterium]
MEGLLCFAEKAFNHPWPIWGIGIELDELVLDFVCSIFAAWNEAETLKDGSLVTGWAVADKDKKGNEPNALKNATPCSKQRGIYAFFSPHSGDRTLGMSFFFRTPQRATGNEPVQSWRLLPKTQNDTKT